MNAVTLATDLDGTLLPPDEDNMYFHALNNLWERRHNNKNLRLFFVTGRHFNSVVKAINEFALPAPDKIICDGGASIYESFNGEWLVNSTYEAHLLNLAKNINWKDIEDLLEGVLDLSLQEDENQSECKVSYYTPADQVITITKQVSEILHNKSLSVAYSFDPSTGKGQIDVLPEGISKAYALLWLWQVGLLNKESLIYAGDAKSDMPVFESGINSIVVSNATSKLKNKLQDNPRKDRLYFSVHPGTVGLVEGCDYYGWE